MKNTYFLCIAKRYDVFDISQYICSIYVHHPWKKDKKKTFISEGLSEIWIKDPQQRPKGHSNPRKMSIYHISSDRNSLDNLGGCLIKFMFSKKATKNQLKLLSDVKQNWDFFFKFFVAFLKYLNFKVRSNLGNLIILLLPILRTPELYELAYFNTI